MRLPHVLHRLAARRQNPTHPTGDLHIRPAATNEEVQAIRQLLTQEVAQANFVPLPEVLPDRHDSLHPELVGASSHGHLVAAAFIGPSEQEAQYAAEIGRPDDAQTILDNVAMVHDLAVEPTHRRRHIALTLKQWLDTWASHHGAHLIVSVPTNDAARNLNQAAGHILTEPDITLVIQIKANTHTYAYPANEGTTWALSILTQTSHSPIRVGVAAPTTHTHGRHHHTVGFLN